MKQRLRRLIGRWILYFVAEYIPTCNCQTDEFVERDELYAAVRDLQNEIETSEERMMNALNDFDEGQ